MGTDIRLKASFWDAFMQLWRTPNDFTPMEDVRAMVTGVAHLVARYDAGAIPVHIDFKNRPMNRQQFAAQFEQAATAAAAHLVGVTICECQPNGLFAGDSRVDCKRGWPSVMCDCRCHPESD